MIKAVRVKSFIFNDGAGHPSVERHQAPHIIRAHVCALVPEVGAEAFPPGGGGVERLPASGREPGKDVIHPVVQGAAGGTAEPRL